MYFPYLYARRAELLALRDSTEELPISTTTIPVLEPVTSSPGDVVRCLQALGEAGVSAVIITNPKHGDFKDQEFVAPWLHSIAPVMNEHMSLLPGLVCRPETTLAQVTEFLTQHPNRDVALLYWSANFTDADFSSLALADNVRFHINLHDQLSAAQRGALPGSKAVDIRDRFHRQTRNADYSGAEFFTSAHTSFHTNSAGYGDFSVLGFPYVPGGGRAHAVAIHAVYRQAASGNIWVEHFVSDDTDISVGTPESKLLQAAVKLRAAVVARPAEFGDDAALQAYADDVTHMHAAGLTSNKRRQISHHIALNHNILSGTF